MRGGPGSAGGVGGASKIAALVLGGGFGAAALLDWVPRLAAVALRGGFGAAAMLGGVPGVAEVLPRGGFGAAAMLSGVTGAAAVLGGVLGAATVLGGVPGVAAVPGGVPGVAVAFELLEGLVAEDISKVNRSRGLVVGSVKVSGLSNRGWKLQVNVRGTSAALYAACAHSPHLLATSGLHVWSLAGS